MSYGARFLLVVARSIRDSPTRRDMQMRWSFSEFMVVIFEG